MTFVPAPRTPFRPRPPRFYNDTIRCESLPSGDGMTCFANRRSWPAALTLALLWAPAWADEAPPPAVFPAESKPTAGRIDEIRKLLAAHKWADAVEQIQSVLTASGDDLVPVDPNRSVACRWLCHSLLALLPADALRSYRDGADGQARKGLELAAETRDARLLRRVVDEAFCSRPGEKALDLLGDLAFERGDFAEAESWWGRLIPPAVVKGDPPAAFALFYPDPQTDPARTRAKLLLARLFRGAYGWADDLQAYRKTYGTAEGMLAGKKGGYADILQQVADEPQRRTAGSDGRLADLRRRRFSRPHRRRAAAPAGTAWGTLPIRKRASIQPEGPPGAGRRADARQGGRSHPAQPLDGLRAGRCRRKGDRRRRPLCDGLRPAHRRRREVVRRGQGQRRPSGPGFAGAAGPALFADRGRRPRLRPSRYAECARSADHGQAQAIGDRPAPPDDASLVVCLSLKPSADGKRELWSIRAGPPENPDKDKAYTVFEGSPLVHDDLLYLAATRFVSGRAVTRVQCYPADAAGEPRERWRQDVCETHEFAERDRRYRRHLLTIAGPYVVYCSHSGAVAALDALTGKPAWAVRYPSRGDKTADGEPSPRDLAPCLFADGRLYVAPADYDRLLCLDASTGETLWQRGPLEVVHLLGVGEGRLIFTTPTGLRAVGAEDGMDAWALPDGGGALAPAGRGLLIGDLVLWPTAAKGPGSFAVYAVRQRDGSQPDDPSLLSNIPAGNLVYADGCLLCADRQTLTIFAPPSMRLEEKEGWSRAEPESPSASLELARAEADAGLTGRALESYARGERLGRRAVGGEAEAAGRDGAEGETCSAIGCGAAGRNGEAAGRGGRPFQARRPRGGSLPLRCVCKPCWRRPHSGSRRARPTAAAVARQTILDAKELAALLVTDDAGALRRAGDFVTTPTTDPPKPPAALIEARILTLHLTSASGKRFLNPAKPRTVCH